MEAEQRQEPCDPFGRDPDSAFGETSPDPTAGYAFATPRKYLKKWFLVRSGFDTKAAALEHLQGGKPNMRSYKYMSASKGGRNTGAAYYYQCQVHEDCAHQVKVRKENAKWEVFGNGAPHSRGLRGTKRGIPSMLRLDLAPYFLSATGFGPMKAKKHLLLEYERELSGACVREKHRLLLAVTREQISRFKNSLLRSKKRRPRGREEGEETEGPFAP
ncbi:hypothetical protein HOP50_02g16880 [Chloropicon primus]|uniref:Uncharacterized protein n=2 Tax=Chloropicon primus TaxID=1764295 RepID=A0A5B8MGA9_9CHLO|nr:hypothetical protein A3770_02p16920 [Chloropicon primus]UPQ98382.1 hypothetical protein HOP50_02g16880 [Chloropicon primus]|eukprot:QDZ19174.1 hypothetical protein A3770_02p16920 [Chloropicon primus]